MCLALLSWGRELPGGGNEQDRLSWNSTSNGVAACLRLPNFLEFSNDDLAIHPAVCASIPPLPLLVRSQGWALWFFLFMCWEDPVSASLSNPP